MHAHVREAAAEHARQRLLDFRFAGFRILVEKSFRRQNHAVQAEPALRGLFVDERLLNRMRFFRRAQPFERHDLLAGHSAHRRHAGPHRRAVHDRRTGAALAQAAAELRAAQLQIVAQGIEQGSRGVEIQGVAPPIDLEIDGAHISFRVESRIARVKGSPPWENSDTLILIAGRR